MESFLYINVNTLYNITELIEKRLHDLNNDWEFFLTKNFH